jgi:hypothetical protein
MNPTYAVAAASRRAGSSSHVPLSRTVRRSAQADLPVGVRHAVRPQSASPDALSLAVCGQDVTGWAVFLQLEFTGGAAADCLRCAQLVRSSRDGREAPTCDQPR